MKVYLNQEQVNLLCHATSTQIEVYQTAIATGTMNGYAVEPQKCALFLHRIEVLRKCIDKLEKADSKF